MGFELACGLLQTPNAEDPTATDSEFRYQTARAAYRTAGKVRVVVDLVHVSPDEKAHGTADEDVRDPMPLRAQAR